MDKAVLRLVIVLITQHYEIPLLTSIWNIYQLVCLGDFITPLLQLPSLHKVDVGDLGKEVYSVSMLRAYIRALNRSISKLRGG